MGDRESRIRTHRSRRSRHPASRGRIGGLRGAPTCWTTCVTARCAGADKRAPRKPTCPTMTPRMSPTSQASFSRSHKVRPKKKQYLFNTIGNPERLTETPSPYCHAAPTARHGRGCRINGPPPADTQARHRTLCGRFLTKARNKVASNIAESILTAGDEVPRESHDRYPGRKHRSRQSRTRVVRSLPGPGSGSPPNESHPSPRRHGKRHLQLP